MTTSVRRPTLADNVAGFFAVVVEDALRVLPPEDAIIGHEPCDYPCTHRGLWMPRRERSGLRFWEWVCLHGCRPTLCDHCHGE